MSEFGRMLGPLRRSIGNMVARGVVAAVNAANKMQTIQMRLMSDEAKSDVEHFEPYGYTSHPLAGAEGVVLFPDGDRSHGMLLVVADRRFRIKSLRPGEVAIHDDLGQKVHLTRDGIVVDGAGLPILFHNTPLYTIEADEIVLRANNITGEAAGGVISMDSAVFQNTGEIKDRSESDGKSMEEMRNIHNIHTHNENNSAGGPTNVPNQLM